ncbi:hypothetical protein [Acetanaerobacterium elongatum]|uniref:UspA domain-containing protein n=1 Tax=Acetanaerobacterium elongatum TaxID=258515 RepID=A0A1G9YQQ9_9FIRM|nr:hypothetical protein [Acetanaerobacterium elongatum]SDN11327.1 hypothetical protein SAMN05192585_11178 [Acetanaerobacterium elongatum]
MSKPFNISTDFDNYNKYISATIVCVTDQINCERIIKRGREIADKTKTNLYVINVDNGSKRDIAAIEHLFHVSKEYNAVMNIFYNNQVLDTLVNCVHEYHAVNIVSGMPQTVNSILNKLWVMMPQIDYYMIGLEGDVTVISSKKAAINQ